MDPRLPEDDEKERSRGSAIRDSRLLTSDSQASFRDHQRGAVRTNLPASRSLSTSFARNTVPFIAI